jgi:hypothetical protein
MSIAAPTHLQNFLERVRTRKARIGVIGLGYVGRPYGGPRVMGPAQILEKG